MRKSEWGAQFWIGESQKVSEAVISWSVKTQEEPDRCRGSICKGPVAGKSSGQTEQCGWGQERKKEWGAQEVGGRKARRISW